MLLMMFMLIRAIIKKEGIVTVIFEGKGSKNGGRMSFGITKHGPNTMEEFVIVLQKYIDNIGAEIATKSMMNNIKIN
jgi:hypothetical protein